MTATEAKRILQPIAVEDFIEDYFSNNKSKCCSLGHLKRLTSENPNDFSYDNCVIENFESELNVASKFHIYVKDFFWKSKNKTVSSLIWVNDSKTDLYPQSNPKDRVMALLDDMIAAGY